MKSFFTFLILVFLLNGCTYNQIEIEKMEKLDKILLQNKIINEKLEDISQRLSFMEEKLEPKTVIKEKTKVVVVNKAITEDEKLIVGSNEYVYIPSIDTKFDARIDTGATTTSLHATDIKEFERDGKKWVKFKLQKSNTFIEKSLPVERIISIKRHGAQNQERYVVKLRVKLGDWSELIDVSLTDRSKFEYPMLIGRNFLNGYLVVDVSKKYLIKTEKDEK